MHRFTAAFRIPHHVLLCLAKVLAGQIAALAASRGMHGVTGYRRLMHNTRRDMGEKANMIKDNIVCHCLAHM